MKPFPKEIINVEERVYTITGYPGPQKSYRKCFWYLPFTLLYLSPVVTSTDALPSISNEGSNNHSKDAKTIRENFRDYFCSSQGEIEWQ